MLTAACAFPIGAIMTSAAKAAVATNKLFMVIVLSRERPSALQ
jgi:hypothetical protein